MLKGIDVSYYQKNIDWQKVKPNIDFAILRCGYGGDYKHQDDKRFVEYANECERLNIPYGVYLYSYATTDAKIESEIKHTLRIINGRKPFCVYIDMEDAKTVKAGKQKLTAFAKRYCEAIQAAGFKAGVYANQNWFTNYIDVKMLQAEGFSIWCARYSDTEPNIGVNFDLWQYTDSGSVDGINGKVDMNIMYNDIRTVATVQNKTVDELAAEVIAGKWGNGKARENALNKAGYDYEEIQSRVNAFLAIKKKSNIEIAIIEIAAEVITGAWGNGAERKNRLTAAGYDYETIQNIVNDLLKK
jgi:GH25 family lysozyme M1 (1,4-beta-N-acetylmuramidase)